MKPEELARRFKQTELDRVRLMRRVVLTVERYAKKRTPVKSGTLRRSITSHVERGGERGIVGTNLDYALPVHEGSRPHLIRPRRAKVLRYKSSGAERDSRGRFVGSFTFARQVQHPGTRARPFLDEGLQDSRDVIEQIIEDAGHDLLTRIAR